MRRYGSEPLATSSGSPSAWARSRGVRLARVRKSDFSVQGTTARPTLSVPASSSMRAHGLVAGGSHADIDAPGPQGQGVAHGAGLGVGRKHDPAHAQGLGHVHALAQELLVLPLGDPRPGTHSSVRPYEWGKSDRVHSMERQTSLVHARLGGDHHHVALHQGLLRRGAHHVPGAVHGDHAPARLVQLRRGAPRKPAGPGHLYLKELALALGHGDDAHPGVAQILHDVGGHGRHAGKGARPGVLHGLATGGVHGAAHDVAHARFGGETDHREVHLVVAGERQHPVVGRQTGAPKDHGARRIAVEYGGHALELLDERLELSGPGHHCGVPTRPQIGEHRARRASGSADQYLHGFGPAPGPRRGVWSCPTMTQNRPRAAAMQAGRASPRPRGRKGAGVVFGPAPC